MCDSLPLLCLVLCHCCVEESGCLALVCLSATQEMATGIYHEVILPESLLDQRSENTFCDGLDNEYFKLF